MDADVRSQSPDHESIAPLTELCKAGRLFDVQAWIAAGKPVNLPPPSPRGRHTKSPLDVAMERGFHSLVQVLLEAGAVQEADPYYSPMGVALHARRLDMVQLLVEHGFDARSINTYDVFATWDVSIMRFFIERGADVVEGQPFAQALCDKIRTVLGVYKECRQRMPELQAQADVALRHHCRDGNMKWVSLLLWAGADPYKPGPVEPGEQWSKEDEGLSALGYAALYEHPEVFALKAIRKGPLCEHAREFMRYLTEGELLPVLKRLLEEGLNPADLDNGGCSAIQHCLVAINWDRHFSSWPYGYGDPYAAGGKRLLDTDGARQRLKAIHLLAKHGGKWMPDDSRAINDARRSLLQMTPDYTTEFVWIMSKYRACSRESILSLLKTPTIKSHTSPHSGRLSELLSAWVEQPEA